MKRAQGLMFLISFFLIMPNAMAQEPPSPSRGVQKLLNDTGGKAKIRVDKITGNAKFIKLPKRSMTSSMITDRSRKSNERAKEFFRKYGNAFGVQNSNTELKAFKTMRDKTGAEHSILKQTYQNIPVFGGELRAHFDPAGQLFAANGTFVSDIKVNMIPRLNSKAAERVAIFRVQRGDQGISKQPGDLREREYRVNAGASELKAVTSELMVYRDGLLKGIPGKDHLVYEVEVVNDDISIREFVYVDAHTGQVINQITGIYHALDREVSETSLANVIWDESNGDPTIIPAGWAGGTAQQITDWQNEIDAAAESYYLFASMTSDTYQSYDGAMATMRTVNNDPGIACPNANWNGTSTNYCSGVTGDDTVAHEWGHAYTEYTNNLIYQWQSGALNESYSDIWGEVVDLLNNRGTDTPGGLRTEGACSTFGTGTPSTDASYRWLSGEDDPAFGGAIRDMWNPTCYGDPGKVTDSQYFCSTADSGGVHTNSGVPNHAFALMVDGGTYNGVTVGAIGLTKAAHIHWGAQNLLTASSNFVDHADALEASCTALVGTDLPALSTSVASAGFSGEVIAVTDCAVVTDAIAAVEFRTPPTFCNFEPLLAADAPALCEDQGAVQSIMVEDFEGGSLPAGWTASSHDVVNAATFDNPGWDVVGNLPSGSVGSFAAFGPDPIIGDCSADVEAGAVALDSPEIVLPMDQVPHLAFDHWVATELGWDGGNLKISVNGGVWTVVPSSAYSFNAYNSAINGGANDNPLADEPAFTGTDGGTVNGSWGQSQVELFGLAIPGDTVQLRFDLGTDGCNGVIGWYVDRLEVYSCSDEMPPVCGDGIVDIGQQCDDGNMADGDGCSSSCQVEEDWICNNPTGTPAMNAVADGSFEAGGIWSVFSSNFGSPICTVATCGTGTGTGPSDGTTWVWFGGIAASEQGNVNQDVVIPTTATNLTFDLEQVICDSADDFVSLFVDTDMVWSITGADALCGNVGYTQQTVDISAYADGNTHQIRFESETFATNGGGSNFFIDNVVISDNLEIPPAPSECQMRVDDVACNATVDYAEGIPESWTVIDSATLGLQWNNISDSGESGNFTGGDGDAASVSSDVFGPADFDTELRSNSFSLANATEATLNYLVNYQNFAAADFLDLDISTDGGSNWSNLVSWNEDHGTFRGTPGEAVAVDLIDYLGESNLILRWRYYDPTTSDWDWYAQVDNVSLSCNLIPNCDGATASRNFLWWPNHRWKEISIFVNDPDGDPVTLTVDSIFQDESVDARGWWRDGRTAPDGRGIGTSTAEVRAERDRWGNGRVYHIGFTADDGRGGVCSGEVQVGVPRYWWFGWSLIDDGPLYDSTVVPDRGGYGGHRPGH